MIVDRSTILLVFFTLLGLITSLLGFLDFKSQGALCPGGVEWVNCARVYMIPQSRILGIHLSELALAYFTLITMTLILGLLFKSSLLTIQMLLSIAGLSLVPYLVYLEVVVARALCLYCTLMHLSLVGLTSVHVYMRLK